LRAHARAPRARRRRGARACRSLLAGSHPRQLFLDHRLVELLEELAWLLQLLPGLQLARFPTPDPRGVVAREHLVLAPVLVDLPELERAGDPAVIAEHLVHLLRSVREKRREEDLQAVDGM